MDESYRGTERILVFAPVGRDGELANHVLARAGLATRVCGSMDELCAQLVDEGAGAALVSEEGCANGGADRLLEALDAQPPWSDLPLVLPASARPSTRGQLEWLDALAGRRSVTFLERPVRVMTLVSALRSALQARRRQYLTRDLLARLGDDVKRRDEFLAVLAHELRNPLATIHSALRLLADRRPRDAEEAHTRRAIQEATASLARLVDDLLDANRLSHGKISLRRRRVPLAHVVQRSIDAVASLVEAREHRLEVDIEPPSMEIDVDPLRMQQVIANLLDNAAKYTPRGGNLRLEARADEREWRLVVQDDGVGLERTSIDAIFAPFSQIVRRGAARGGLGIGLTLIRQLVELHGGRIEASSAGSGRGSTFTIRLPRPAAPSARVRVKRPAARRAETAGKLDVLLVEDDAVAAGLLGKLLQRSGHAVRTALSGAEARSAARAGRADVALLDIDLPDATGYELAVEMREMQPHLLLVALTGFSDESSKRRIASAGFDHHLTKPLDFAALDEILAERFARR